MRRKFSYNMEMILGSFVLLLLIGVTIFLAGKVKTTGNINAVFIILFIDLALVALSLPIIKMYLNFIKGDYGEMDVKFILDKLPGFYYLSDVMIEKKGNIDFIVIGQTGIWTIEVKNQVERVIIHDKYLDKDLGQAYAEKMSLQNFLAQNGIFTPVTPVLVFANKTEIHFGMVPQKGVYVIGKSWLEELLTKHSTGYLTPGKCLQIKELIKPYSSKIN